MRGGAGIYIWDVNRREQERGFGGGDNARRAAGERCIERDGKS